MGFKHSTLHTTRTPINRDSAPLTNCGVAQKTGSMTPAASRILSGDRRVGLGSSVSIPVSSRLLIGFDADVTKPDDNML
jgi:hypothetical protein